MIRPIRKQTRMPAASSTRHFPYGNRNPAMAWQVME